jgi:hypothetical protein
MAFEKIFKAGCFLFLGLVTMTQDANSQEADSVLVHPFPLHCNFGCPIKKGAKHPEIYPNQLFTMGLLDDGKPGHWLAYYVTTTLLSERDERRAQNKTPSLTILSDATTPTPGFFWGNKSPAWNKLLVMEERLAEEPGIANAFVITGSLRHHTDVVSAETTDQPQGSLWKIISINTTAHAFVSAFIFPKGSEDAESYCPYLVDVDAIERETGLLFFPLSELIDPSQRPTYFKSLAPHIECP